MFSDGFFKFFFGLVLTIILCVWAFYAFVAVKAVNFVSDCDKPALVTKTENGKTTYSMECVK